MLVCAGTQTQTAESFSRDHMAVLGMTLGWAASASSAINAEALMEVFERGLGHSRAPALLGKLQCGVGFDSKPLRRLQP